MRVGILGAGAYGTAMAGVLRDNRHRVKYFDPYRFPDVSIEDVLTFAQVLVIATPAEVISVLIKQLPGEAFHKPTIILTKGIMTLEYWDKFDYYEIISGPGFADEIAKKKRTKLTVAAKGALEGKTLSEDLFANKYIKFDKTEDRIGVALLSGLKNIYAIESGRRGLASPSADFKEYAADAARECERFLLYNGGFVETVRLSAGLGDLVLTCGSEMSRNYQFGTLLGGRRRIAERKHLAKKFLRDNTVEGVFATKDIEKQGLGTPKENEILTDAIRRIKNVIKR